MLECRLPSTGMPMDATPLSFALLDEKVSRYVEATTSDERAGKWERWSMVAGFASGGAGFLLTKIVTGRPALVLLNIALVMELIGLGLWLVLRIRREWRDFKMPHAQYARELDQSYTSYRELACELNAYPQVELRRLLRYLKARRNSLAYSTGLLSGNVERLGLLPVLAMLYVQFKDWKFGDWTSLWSSVHFVGGLLLWAIFLAYLASWWLVRLKMRLDVYQAFLEEALEECAAHGQAVAPAPDEPC